MPEMGTGKQGRSNLEGKESFVQWDSPVLCLIFFLIFVVLKIESRAPCILGKFSTTLLNPHPLFSLILKSNHFGMHAHACVHAHTQP